MLDPVKALKEILAQEQSPSALLILSPDRVRRERVVANVLKKFSSVSDKSSLTLSNLIQLDAAQLNNTRVQALRDEVLSVSLFTGQRFFLITNVDELSSALTQSLLTLLKEKISQATFLLCAEKLPVSSVIYKYFLQQKNIIELAPLKNFELQRWVQKELKNQGLIATDDQVIEAIVQGCEASTDRIVSLIEKLALFVENSEVSLADISQLSKQVPDANEFVFLEMLGKKQTWKPEVLLTHILEAGKSPFALLSLLARNYSNYLRMACLREQGLQPAQIRQALGLPPWLFNKQYESSLKYSSEQLKKCMKAILIADATLKNRSLGPEAIFSQLTYRLTL